MRPDLRVVSTVPAIHGASSNPFLRGIPDPTDDKALVRLIAHDPFRDPVWREANQDIARLPDYMRTVFVPTPKAIRVTRTLLTMLRNGYMRRDPRLPAVWSSYNLSDEFTSYGQVSPIYADGIAISGITGLGKSHLINRFLSALPQTIKHQDIGKQLSSVTQIVWIYLDMSTAAGLEALLLELLDTIDDLLGVKQYGLQHASSRTSVDRLINTLIRALKTHFCGILVLDEIQRLNFGLRKASERVRNFLLKLLNAGIPVVLVGNPLGFQFQENAKGEQSAQLTRRLVATEMIRLDPADGPDDLDWQILVRGLWRCQLIEGNPLLNETWFDLFYQLTGGFPALLAQLLATSQQKALRAGQRALTAETIQLAALEMTLIQKMKPMIDAFVAKDPFRLHAYSDIDWQHYQHKWTTASSRTISPLLAERTGAVDSVTAKDLVVKDVRAFKADQTRRSKTDKPPTESGSDGALREYYLESLDSMLKGPASNKKDG